MQDATSTSPFSASATQSISVTQSISSMSTEFSSSQITAVPLFSSQSVSSSIQTSASYQSPSSSRGPPSVHSVHSDPTSIHSLTSAPRNRRTSVHPDDIASSPTTTALSDATRKRGNQDEEDQVQIDAMGAVNNSDSQDHDEGGDDDRHGYFGSSSGLSFVKEVRQVIGKKTASYSSSSSSPPSSLFGGNSDERTRSSSFLRGSSLRPPSSVRGGHYRGIMLNDYVLPPRKVADDLVKTYWNLVHCLYPFLHRPLFMGTYVRLWNCSESEDEEEEGININSGTCSFLSPDNFFFLEDRLETDPLFQCILNLVFALGCQLSPEINELEREPASDVFFQRSKKLLHFDILEEGNIMVVQALLLMGQYLQCTNMPGRCWLVVGLAIRVAQGLGLHLDGRPPRSMNASRGRSSNQLDKELKKRLWGGCIVLDR